MKRTLTITITCVITICATSLCTRAQTFEKATLFADQQAAVDLLLTEDSFTNRWSPFDINSRLGTQGGTKDDLYDLIGQSARSWTDDEKETLKALIAEIDSDIAAQNLHLPIPDTIFIVKTSGAEEGGAPAYTRANYIVLAATMIKSLPDNRDGVKGVLVHELFHILSRNDDTFRRKMYAAIGFRECNEVPYPQHLENLRITNPDAPLNDSYITLDHNGESMHCMMILYASRPYESGSFFQYITSRLMVVDEAEDAMRVRYADEKPVLYEVGDLPDFFEQVGRNTNYILHPEEILAENFRFVVAGQTDIPSAEVVEKMTSALQN